MTEGDINSPDINSPDHLRPIPSRSAWVRDFARLRMLSQLFLVEVNNCVRNGMGEKEVKENYQARADWHFGTGKPISDAYVRIATFLLKLHEHDMKRQRPDWESGEEQPTLSDEDVAIMRRFIQATPHG